MGTIRIGIPKLLRQHVIALQYRSAILDLAKEQEIAPSIILGLVSHESDWGLGLKPPGPGGTGDFVPRKPKPGIRDGKLPPDGRGFGRGLCQIDYDYHEFARSDKWYEAIPNLEYGISYLAQNRDAMIENLGQGIPNLTYAMLASYNAPLKKIIKALKLKIDPDIFTTDKDYAKSVMQRANYFLTKGWTL